MLPEVTGTQVFAQGANRRRAKMSSCLVDFVFYRTKDGKLLGTNHRVNFTLDRSTTYEEVVLLLVEKEFLLPLDPPLRYSMSLVQVGRIGVYEVRSREVTFSEGQTLASAYPPAWIMLDRNPDRADRDTGRLVCSISIVIEASPLPKEQPVSGSPSWDKIVNAFLTSLAANAINFTASVVTITTVLIVIEKSWSKKQSTDSASPQGHSSQPSETGIIAIRLRMTHGDDPEFEEWLTEPDRLKHYIDAFNQPSSSIRPLQAIFVQRNGKALKVDVLKGAQNNPRLDVLLSYLNIDSAEK